MHETWPEGSQVFHGSWRGGTTWLSGTLGLMSLGIVWLAAGSDDTPWVVWGVMAFLGGAALLLLKPLFNRLPVLVVGPSGVGGAFTRGHTVPWSEVAQAEHQTVQGQEMISLVLREGSPWLAPTKPLIGARRRRGASLMPLRKADFTSTPVCMPSRRPRHGWMKPWRTAILSNVCSRKHPACGRCTRWWR
ncbi:MAG: hypothetical protein MUF44_15820 [Hydrogenophaga sp.]|nr:hypothetical protein [Hydrogenophaga sp.]